MKKTMVLIASIALVLVMSSCTSTPFSQKTSNLDDQMLSIEDVSFNLVYKTEDLKSLGTIEATRTVTQIVQNNGDYVTEMGDFKYIYTEGTDSVPPETEIEGTRVIGNLKTAASSSMGSAPALAIPGFDIGAIFGDMMGSASDTPAPPTASSTKNDPRSIAMDAVNYDLIQLAAKKGGESLLRPEYSWSIESEVAGTDDVMFFFLSSRTYNTQIYKYTVTARATVVTFDSNVRRSTTLGND